MIAIDKATALILYLCIFLSLCLGSWLISHLKTRNKKGLPPIFQLNQCEYCAYCYLAETGQQVTKCPQCGSYNKCP